ncbi:MAG: DegT/DnrJ/EryC1/StrS family aminotransferase [Deltaproteobacteria bacterium]|nr:DegT/DnrJ/EryC1/StrS family aminotransferase [Deltaproteobacteria bacterium]
MTRDRDSTAPRRRRVPAVRTYYDARDLREAYRAVMSTDFRRGDDVATFEAAFRDFLGAESAATFPSARVAFYYALRALDLPPGSTVLMTPIAIPDFVSIIRCAGLVPRFVDMDAESLGYGTEALAKAMDASVRVVLVTYLYGIVPYNIEDVIGVARAGGAVVIEDISQCLGAKLGERRIGMLGDAVVYSLSSFKTCSSLYGGVLASGNRSLVERARETAASELHAPRRAPFLWILLKIVIHRVMTSEPWFSTFTFRLFSFIRRLSPGAYERFLTGNISRILGFEKTALFMRMRNELLFWYTDFQARIALRQLKRVEDVNEELRRQAEGLLEIDGIPTRTPRTHPDAQNVFWRFPIRVGDLVRAKSEFARHGVEVSKNALTVCSDVGAFVSFGSGAYPETRLVDSDHALIPIHAHLDAEARRVVREAVRLATNAR